MQPFKAYFYGPKDKSQASIIELLIKFAKRVPTWLTEMIPNFYYYLVSTFPQVVFIVFIFLVYRYISTVRKGRQTKSLLPKDQSNSSEQSGHISNHLFNTATGYYTH